MYSFVELNMPCTAKQRQTQGELSREGRQQIAVHQVECACYQHQDENGVIIARLCHLTAVAPKPKGAT